MTSNTLIFLAVNIAGVYIHDRTQHAQRKAFLDTRNCIAARLDMEDENEKLVRPLPIELASPKDNAIKNYKVNNCFHDFKDATIKYMMKNVFTIMALT